MNESFHRLINILRREDCSCVILTAGGSTVRCRERGVRDLYRLLTEEPATLNHALVADKVVGKGAAALMVLGDVSEVYARTISDSALAMLTDAGIRVEYGELAPHIINRAGTGICPVENLCADCTTARQCFPRIKKFVETILKVK